MPTFGDMSGHAYSQSVMGTPLLNLPSVSHGSPEQMGQIPRRHMAPGSRSPTNSRPVTPRRSDDDDERDRDRDRDREPRRPYRNPLRPEFQSQEERMFELETRVRTLESKLSTQGEPIARATHDVGNLKMEHEKFRGETIDAVKSVESNLDPLIERVMRNEGIVMARFNLLENEVAKWSATQETPPGLRPSTSHPVFRMNAEDTPDFCQTRRPSQTPVPESPVLKPENLSFMGAGHAAGASAEPVAPAASNAVAPQAFDQKLWIADQKTPKELKPLGPLVEQYKNWADRSRDHLSYKNPLWDDVLDEIQKSKVSIKLDQLSTVVIKGKTLDMRWAAGYLWNFQGTHMENTMYNRRAALANGEEKNGIELWRRLFSDNEGGGEQVETCGVRDLHGFPSCTRVEDLANYVGEWQLSRTKHGGDMPEVHLKTMFMNMLPSVVAEDVRKQKHLDTLAKIIGYVQAESFIHKDKQLGKMHSERLRKRLQSGKSVGAMPVMETETDAGFNDEIRGMKGQIEALVAAIQQKQRPHPHKTGNKTPPTGTRTPPDRRSKNGLTRPDPKFGTCWHCKKPGHTRTACAEFKKMIADNGGKIPKGYKGAWEKSIAANPLLPSDAEEEASDDDSEFSDTGSWLGCAPCIVSAPSLFSKADFTTPNPFKSLMCGIGEECEDDDCESEETVMMALQQLTSQVHCGPKLSQKQRRRSPAPLTRQQVNAIAHKIKSGEIALPDLVEHAPNDDDLVAVWALVDSGCGTHIADAAKHFPGATVVESEGQRRGQVFINASNGEIANEGQITVHMLTNEGRKKPTCFQNAKVGLPILSVKVLCDESDVSFTKKGGTITDRDSGEVTAFVKRCGVYFAKMWVPRSVCPNGDSEPGFARPGQA